jgi:chorismate-pyruvate lyase
MKFSRILAAGLAALFPTSLSAQSPNWPDGFVSRVEILALMQTLNASLLASRSATATLEQWCVNHKMAPEPKIVAHRLAGEEKPPSPETRSRLAVGEGEAIKYRRVELSCGDHVLSEADNWYVPGRLSAEMNRALETTDTPFGKAVAALQPFRRTIEMKVRYSPLPEGWELSAGSVPTQKPEGALALPHALFEHTAVLYAADQRPFSEVHETYTKELLDFGPASSMAPH